MEAHAVVRLAFTVLAAWVAVVWVCGAVYVAVTYIEATPYVPKRSRSDTLRSVVRECWCVAWTQPMLPVFQLAGKRLGGDKDRPPIVLVHGYSQNRVDFLYLARRLRAAGSGPIYACNFFWPRPFERSSVTVSSFVENVRRRTGAQRVDLLTHSSGGLLALDLLREHPDRVGRVAVIAIPWRGVTWRGPVLGHSGSQLRAGSEYALSRPEAIHGGPVLSIYSVHDNLVHPAETSQVAGPDVSRREVSNLGHLAILFDRKVADAVCDFLLPCEGPDPDSAAE